MEYDVFICHASEDKDFVEPLAKALMGKNLRVWYAPFELKIGDSLRQEIDRGLANSRYGIVVLSEAFFTKNWPQSELDALASRQNEEGRKVILPIWHKVEANYVRDKSPLLHSLLAARSSDGMEFVVGQIFSVCSEPIESTQKSVFQASGDIGLRERCLYVIRRGDRTEWVKLVDELQTPIEGQLIVWKHDGETAIQKDSDTWREAVLKAVDICMPGFVPIFASVEAGQKELWNDATRILRRLALLEKKMDGGITRVLRIGLEMLYVPGSIGMAIASETGQYDFVWNWMLMPMPGYKQGMKTPWADIRAASWPPVRDDCRNPFRLLLDLYQSEYIRGFFPSEDRMKEYLFKANLLQSIVELRLWTLTEEDVSIVEAGDTKYWSDIKVFPFWCLLKPSDFEAWSWDLFASQVALLRFFSFDSTDIIAPEQLWRLWKGWKKICESLLYQDPKRWPSLRTEWLMLPGEPDA
jgi:hypothetical protein